MTAAVLTAFWTLGAISVFAVMVWALPYRIPVGAFARSRRGLVIACEADGATWLPFRPHHTAKALRGHSREVVYVQRNGREVPAEQIEMFTR